MNFYEGQSDPHAAPELLFMEVFWDPVLGPQLQEGSQWRDCSFWPAHRSFYGISQNGTDLIGHIETQGSELPLVHGLCMWTRASASIYPCSNWVAVTSDPQHLRAEGGAAGRLCVHHIHRGHPPALRAAARPGRLLGMAVSLFSEGWKTFAA